MRHLPGCDVAWVVRARRARDATTAQNAIWGVPRAHKGQMDLGNTPQPSPSCPGVNFAVFGPFFVSFQKRASGGRSPERFYPSSTAVWMTTRSDVEQHAIAALITRALSVELSSVLRTAECHSRRTLVSCGNVHRSMCHCSRPTSALLDHLSCSPQAQMTLPLSAPAQSSSRASVGKLPCIIFVINSGARSDLARPIAPCGKVARSGPSFSRKREIDRRRWEERVVCL